MAAIIELNVGGRHFTTFQSTLEKYPDTFFDALVSDRWETKDKDGRYFIDRDGDLFAHILNYLRTDRISKQVDIDDFVNEMQYFGFTCDIKMYYVLNDNNLLEHVRKEIKRREKVKSANPWEMKAGYPVPISYGGEIDPSKYGHPFYYATDDYLQMILESYDLYNSAIESDYCVIDSTDVATKCGGFSFSYQKITVAKFISPHNESD